MEGGDLFDYLCRAKDNDGGKEFIYITKPAVVCGLLECVALGLSCIHDQAGMTHGDVKAKNILPTYGPKGRSAPPVGAKICDFGLSRLTFKSPESCSGSSDGTPTHMAPELVLGTATHPSPETDMFSFAMVIVEVIMIPQGFDNAWNGRSMQDIRHAYENDDSVASRPPVKSSFAAAEDVMRKCWVTDPGKRLTSTAARKLLSKAFAEYNEDVNNSINNSLATMARKSMTADVDSMPWALKMMWPALGISTSWAKLVTKTRLEYNCSGESAEARADLLVRLLKFSGEAPALANVMFLERRCVVEGLVLFSDASRQNAFQDRLNRLKAGGITPCPAWKAPAGKKFEYQKKSFIQTESSLKCRYAVQNAFGQYPSWLNSQLSAKAGEYASAGIKVRDFSPRRARVSAGAAGAALVPRTPPRI